MSTVRTCTTSKDGWALYSHFLGNLLLVIQMQGEDRGEEDEDSKDKRGRVIYDAWAQLAGNLYMIMRRMRLSGHDDDAAKMQQIIDMVVEQDLTDPEVCKAIHARHNELDANYREFKAKLAKLKAEHAG